MDRTSEIRELSASEVKDVTGGNLMQAFAAGIAIGAAKGARNKVENQSRSDLGQQLQLALQEANNIYQ